MNRYSYSIFILFLNNIYDVLTKETIYALKRN